MGNNDTRRGIKVYLDTTDYTKGMQAIVQKTAEYTHSLQELEAAGEGNSKAADKMRQTLVRLQETENKYKNDVTQTKRVLENLSGSTYNQLIGVRKKLDAQLKNSVQGTEKYNAILEQQRRVGLQVAKVDQDRRSSLGAQSSAYSQATSSISEYIGKATMLVASVMAIKYTMENSVEAYASMEEAMSKGRKYIGMTEDQVRDLNKSLQQIDTRTSREKLNALAGDAGKLGVAGKEGALEFVDAANQINVALGEDLGEDAVKNIGKLAMTFGEDKTKGLRGAMLATGSAVNAVAQSSSASEPYLVDFLARVGSTAHLMHISQADLIGYASSLDQNMAEVEVAGTTFQNVMVKMFQTPAKFAKMAGMDVKEFTNLIKTDTNEAFIQMMQNLNKMGGMDKLAPIFADMNLDGQKAVQILSIFAGNINQVRQEQLNANKAYNEATSITQEYNIQNNTAQAVIEKKKKAILDETVALGERLMPVYEDFMDGQIHLIEITKTVIGWFIDYSKELIVAAVTLASLLLVKKADILLSKESVLWNNRIVTSLKAIGTAIKKNPYTLIAAAAAAAIVYLIDLKNKNEEIAKSEDRLAAVNESATKTYIDQSAKVDTLTAILNDNGIALNERKKALETLKSIIPGYNAQLTDEGNIINNNTNAIKDYLVQLQKQIRLKAAKDELVNLYKTERELQKSEADQSAAYWKTKQTNTLQGYNRNALPAKLSRIFGTSDEDSQLNTLQKTQTALNGVKNNISAIQDEIGLTASDLADVKEINTDITDTNKKAVPYVPEAKKQNEKAIWKQKLDIINAAYEEQKAATKQFKTDNNLTEEQYNMIALSQESEYQSKRIKSLDKSLSTEKKASAKVEIRKEIAEANSAMLDAQVKYDNASVEETKTCRDEDLKQWNSYYDTQKSNYEVKLSERNMTQEDYDTEMTILDESVSERRLAIENNYLAAIKHLGIKAEQIRVDAEKEAGTSVLAAASENALARAKVQENMYQRLASIADKEVGTIDAPANYQMQLAMLDSYYNAAKQKLEEEGKDSTELTKSYAQAKLSVEKKYQDEKNELLDEYGLSTSEDRANRELEVFQKTNKKVLLNEKQTQKALGKIRDKAGDDWKETMSKISAVTSAASDAVTALQDAEIAGMEAKYDVEIEAAGDNTEEVTRLENEKAQAKLDIQKKYADIDFAVKASEIIADTAVSIMKANADLGPIAGPIAATLMGITGAAQLVVANAEREKIKNMTLSSSSSSSSTASRVTQYATGKYDVMGADDRRSYNGVPYLESASGVITHPALISEQGSELIINAADLKLLQKDVNYPLVLKSIENAHRGTPVTQHASGTISASSTSDSSRSASSAASNSDYAELLTAVKALTEKMGSPTKAYVTLTDLSAKQELKSRQEKRFTRGDKKNK